MSFLSLDLDHILNTVTLWVTTYAVKILAALVIFFVGKWLARKLSYLIKRGLERNRVDVTLTRFLEKVIYYALFILVMVAAAGQAGVNTASFLTIIGAAGLAVGLALKDSLSNLASGVMLILFRPFRVDDFVTAGGVSGTVQQIDIFNTILHTPDNQKVVVPNANITSAVITNVTANATRRVDLVVGISYEDDIVLAKQVLAEILGGEPRILDTPPPLIAVSALGDSSVDLLVRPWVKVKDYWPVYWALTEQIKLTFDARGISFPFPQRDVHLYNET